MKKSLLSFGLVTVYLSLTACNTDHQPSANKAIQHVIDEATNKLNNQPDIATTAQILAEQQTQSELSAIPEAELSPTLRQTGSDEFVFAGTKGKLAYNNYLSSIQQPKIYVANFAICNDNACQNDGKGLKTGQLQFEIVPKGDGGLSLTNLQASQLKTSDISLNHATSNQTVATNDLPMPNVTGTLTLIDENRRIFGLNLLDSTNQINPTKSQVGFF